MAWRAGLGLNPLDVTEPADVAWLEALVWPEHHHRRDRLRAAAKHSTGPPAAPRCLRTGASSLLADVTELWLRRRGVDDVEVVVEWWVGGGDVAHPFWSDPAEPAAVGGLDKPAAW